MDVDSLTITLSAFALVSSLVLLVTMLVSRREALVDNEMTLGDRVPPAQSTDQRGRALPQLGSVLMPGNESKVGRIRARLLQAGLYQRHSTAIFLGVKMILMVTPMMVGFLLSTAGLITLSRGVALGAVVGLIGTVAPGFFLDYRKACRQRTIRRALPDALDVVVICMEGGLSLPAAIDRVAVELKQAHPLLAREMSIVRREIQLGRTTGEALRQFADRFDVEELRSLAAVISQAERFGASIVKALRVHADTLRVKRYQHAEGQAQKAPVKLIFPVVLCIFPALYIILMGPAGIRVYKALENI